MRLQSKKVGAKAKDTDRRKGETEAVGPRGELDDGRLDHTIHIYNMLYEEQQKLGAGGMGTVYKVRNKADHQLYAVKKFHGTRNSGDTLIMQYDHPNIVRYYGCFFGPSSGFESEESDDSDWLPTESQQTAESRSLGSPLRERPTHSVILVMHYYPGGTLRGYMDRRKKVDPTANMRFVLELAAGLQYLHKQGVIHRDLKPSNIYLTAEDRIKIGDFDLATQHEPFARHSKRVGTPAYVSPEQWVGHDYDFHTDIWSLGLIMFELYCDFHTVMERDRTLTALRQSQLIPAQLWAAYPREMELVQQLAQPVPSKRLPLPVLHHELLLMMGMEGTEGRSDFLAEVASEAGMGRSPQDSYCAVWDRNKSRRSLLDYKAEKELSLDPSLVCTDVGKSGMDSGLPSPSGVAPASAPVPVPGGSREADNMRSEAFYASSSDHCHSCAFHCRSRSSSCPSGMNEMTPRTSPTAAPYLCVPGSSSESVSSSCGLSSCSSLDAAAGYSRKKW
jgi:serine/threonine protein kinase